MFSGGIVIHSFPSWDNSVESGPERSRVGSQAAGTAGGPQRACMSQIPPALQSQWVGLKFTLYHPHLCEARCKILKINTLLNTFNNDLKLVKIIFSEKRCYHCLMSQDLTSFAGRQTQTDQKGKKAVFIFYIDRLYRISNWQILSWPDCKQMCVFFFFKGVSTHV